MKYTGNYEKDMEVCPVIPEVIAEGFPFSQKLVDHFRFLYTERELFGETFVFKCNRKDPRVFLATFFSHWTEAIALYMAGQGRKPNWF